MNSEIKIIKISLVKSKSALFVMYMADRIAVVIWITIKYSTYTRVARTIPLIQVVCLSNCKVKRICNNSYNLEQSLQHLIET